MSESTPRRLTGKQLGDNRDYVLASDFLAYKARVEALLRQARLQIQVDMWDKRAAMDVANSIDAFLSGGKPS